ncbi:hypothetical protein [Alkaliphilus hydrothermalis]|uniref:Uncharacterized protein n=1 Tax=Alkaliphilus hydrothermalis TaxID=1482730 RepID=A0ABS2NTY8_9FIRM|nr:hypothetical protein [Alkaliphilus hydrothermalis]MBM7616444.1 hypothetical protein [Alkaliphilus hydrothermalis]
MGNNKVINLKKYRETKTRIKETASIENTQNHSEEEERIKTLDLFMKVIATMYKESYK